MPGLYVACWLDPDTAERVAVAGGQPPHTLHITLAHLGDLSQLASWVPGDAVAAAARVAARTPVIDAVLPGLGVFKGPASDVLYASVDAAELSDLHERLVEQLRNEMIEPDRAHGFTPHVTLAYLPEGAYVDAAAWEPVPVTLKAVTVVSDDDSFRVELPLLGPPRRREPPEPTADDVVRIAKVDEEQRLVYGVVLEPDLEDTQGDVMTAAEIEKTAHQFIYDRAPIGLQHLTLAPDSVRPVESFLAPCDFAYPESPGEPIRKGSWVLVAHVPNDTVWKAARDGIFTGWSVAGLGVRRPL